MQFEGDKIIVKPLTVIIGDNSSGKSYLLFQISQTMQESILLPSERSDILKLMGYADLPIGDAMFVAKFKRLAEEFNELDLPQDLSEVLGVRKVYKSDNKLHVLMNNYETYPLSYAPSGVRSALPIVLALNSKSFPTVLIDEPEDHLHPRAQRVVAKMIADAVKRGKYVAIATNSDYVFYTLSYVVVLYRKDKEAGLDPNAVSAYLLKRRGKYTEVIRLKVDEDGMEEEDFMKVTEEMLDERAKIFD